MFHVPLDDAVLPSQSVGMALRPEFIPRQRHTAPHVASCFWSVPIHSIHLRSPMSFRSFRAMSRQFSEVPKKIKVRGAGGRQRPRDMTGWATVSRRWWRDCLSTDPCRTDPQFRMKRVDGRCTDGNTDYTYSLWPAVNGSSVWNTPTKYTHTHTHV